jgi:hypothetical protein
MLIELIMKSIAWSRFNPDTDETVDWPIHKRIKVIRDQQWSNERWIVGWTKLPKIIATMMAKANPSRDMIHIYHRIKDGDLMVMDKDLGKQKDSQRGEESITMEWIAQTGIKMHKMALAMCRRSKRQTEIIAGSIRKVYEDEICVEEAHHPRPIEGDEENRIPRQKGDLDFQKTENMVKKDLGNREDLNPAPISGIEIEFSKYLK